MGANLDAKRAHARPRPPERTRRLLDFHRGATQAGRDVCAGAGESERRSQSAQARGSQSGPKRLERGGPAEFGDRSRRPRVRCGLQRSADGSGRNGVADCMRKCGKLAAGQSLEPLARDDYPRGTGSEAKPYPADGADGKPSAIADGWRRGNTALDLERAANSDAEAFHALVSEIRSTS